jgi:hypothetical protein
VRSESVTAPRTLLHFPYLYIHKEFEAVFGRLERHPLKVKNRQPGATAADPSAGRAQGAASPSRSRSFRSGLDFLHIRGACAKIAFRN